MGVFMVPAATHVFVCWYAYNSKYLISAARSRRHHSRDNSQIQRQRQLVLVVGPLSALGIFILLKCLHTRLYTNMICYMHINVYTTHYIHIYKIYVRRARFLCCLFVANWTRDLNCK